MRRYTATITTRACDSSARPSVVRVHLVFDHDQIASRRVGDSARNHAIEIAMEAIYARFGPSARDCIGYSVMTETDGRSPFTEILPFDVV